MNQASALIVFGPNQWDEFWQTRQHITSRLGKRGWSCVYTAGPFYVWDWGSSAWEESKYLSRFEDRYGVKIDRPGQMLLRWPKMKNWDQIIINRHARRLMRAVKWESANNRVAHLFHPSFYPYLEHLGRCHVVYHADDAFSLMPGWTPELELMEIKLVEKADLVLATSPGVARQLPANGPLKAQPLPNGADSHAFLSGLKEPCPPDLATIPQPRIGYAGAINPKVNLRLIAEIARRRPEWHWVFVGPVLSKTEESCATCEGLGNVHFLGLRPYASMPAYTSHMDVNTICCRSTQDGWWSAIYPLKLHEYLAVGKPIVAADIEALRQYASVLAISETVEEWIAALENALSSGGVGSRAARLAVAMDNTWDNRVNQLESWFEDMLEADNLNGQRVNMTEKKG